VHAWNNIRRYYKNLKINQQKNPTPLRAEKIEMVGKILHAINTKKNEPLFMQLSREFDSLYGDFEPDIGD
jgi:hypothetical protein